MTPDKLDIFCVTKDAISKENIKEHLLVEPDNDWNKYQSIICKLISVTGVKKDILNKWFSKLFPWPEKCENQFGFNNLKGYDTKRLYAYLAERYLSFWFKKYTVYKEQP
tara:strand:+ start:273 stop:599 length:327 start_codon:yes stop_codon:yes gene_type:complete